MGKESNESSADTLRAGVIGLGQIGGGVAVSLARSARVPVVYDIRPDATDGLPGVPPRLSSPADVAQQCDVLFIAVVDAAQATEVLTGDDGVLASAHPNLVIVIMSTIAVPAVLELAELCASHGVTLLDCGVTRGDKAAENGIVAIVGGPDDVVQRVKPVFDDFAKATVHCGPLGAGMTTKIARNIVTYGSWRVAHEAGKLVEAAGIDRAKLLEVIETADPEGSTLLAMQHLRVTGTTSRLSAIHAQEKNDSTARMMDKDLAAAQQLAHEVGVHLPVVDATRAEITDTLSGL